MSATGTAIKVCNPDGTLIESTKNLSKIGTPRLATLAAIKQDKAKITRPLKVHR